jgi:hypothetical protein
MSWRCCSTVSPAGRTDCRSTGRVSVLPARRRTCVAHPTTPGILALATIAAAVWEAAAGPQLIGRVTALYSASHATKASNIPHTPAKLRSSQCGDPEDCMPGPPGSTGSFPSSSTCTSAPLCSRWPGVDPAAIPPAHLPWRWPHGRAELSRAALPGGSRQGASADDACPDHRCSRRYGCCVAPFAAPPDGWLPGVTCSPRPARTTKPRLGPQLGDHLRVPGLLVSAQGHRV